jgi:hypothetical protein
LYSSRLESTGLDRQHRRIKNMDVTRANEVAQEMLLNAYNTYRGHGVSWKDVKDQIALLEWLVDLTMDPDNEEVISQL